MTDDNVVHGDFTALGHAGSGAYIGLEVIELADIMLSVVFQSDEVTAVCPVTGQPDIYTVEIKLHDTPASIESKSLKLYLNTFRNEGIFCEGLAQKIKDDIYKAIDSKLDIIFHDEQVEVTVTQKRRGGVEIEARA